MKQALHRPFSLAACMAVVAFSLMACQRHNDADQAGATASSPTTDAAAGMNTTTPSTQSAASDSGVPLGAGQTTTPAAEAASPASAPSGPQQ